MPVIVIYVCYTLLGTMRDSVNVIKTGLEVIAVYITESVICFVMDVQDRQHMTVRNV